MYSKNIKTNRKLEEGAPCQRIKLHDTKNYLCYDYLISGKFKIFEITLKFILIIKIYFNKNKLTFI